MNSLDRFINALLALAQPGSLVARYRLGLGILHRKYRQIKKRIQSRHLPTHGFREDLVKDGQDGEMYRHLYFHLACYLLGPPGWVLSWGIGQLDVRQAASGRQESQTEVRDNIAGRKCGSVLKELMQEKIDEDTARQRLREILS